MLNKSIAKIPNLQAKVPSILARKCSFPKIRSKYRKA